MHQGFTHVFESTFESVEGMAEYVSHPAHVEAANRFLPHLEKVIVLDYKPTAVHLWTKRQMTITNYPASLISYKNADWMVSWYLNFWVNFFSEFWGRWSCLILWIWSINWKIVGISASNPKSLPFPMKYNSCGWKEWKGLRMLKA